MAITTHIYPKLGDDKSKNLSDIKNLTSDINDAVVAYLKSVGVDDPQGFALSGLSKADKAVKAYQKQLKGTKNELAVRAGLTKKGDLVLSLKGIVPGKKKPEPVDDELVIRKGMEAAATEQAEAANKVVNLQKGDKVIDRAAAKQAAKFDAANEALEDDPSFAGITKGTVVLAAHGSRVTEKGTVIGKKLGKKTPEEIVALLLDNDDADKRLSTTFTGTVMLSGCFTASGGITDDEGYDYDAIAQKVAALLKKRGLTCTVKGVIGVATTKDSGDKTGVIDQAEHDRLKKELARIEREFNELAKAKNATDDDPRRQTLARQLDRLRDEYEEINDTRQLQKIEGLMGRFGLGRAK